METINLLHITKTKNMVSIMKTGLVRFKPRLEHHYNIFKRDLPRSWDSKVSYFNEINLKWLKDFTYWETWGAPINTELAKISHDQYLTGVRLDPKKKIKLRPDKFTILEVTIPTKNLGTNNYRHVQTYDDPCWEQEFKNMQSEYEHDDKPIIIATKGLIRPKDISIVGTAESTIGRNDKISIALNM